MAETDRLVPLSAIASRIMRFRGQNVIRDSDLAELYGVTTRRLNEQAARNAARFPADFRFQLVKQEAEVLRSHFATSKVGRGGRRTLPWVYTEHGAIMAAAVLNSPRAIEVSVIVVRAFVRIRQVLAVQKELAGRLEDLERTVGTHGAAINSLMTAIRSLTNPPIQRKRLIGFRVSNPCPARRRLLRPARSR